MKNFFNRKLGLYMRRGYNNLTYTDKIIRTLRSKDKCMTIKEIAEFLNKFENKDMNVVYNSVFSVTASNIKKGLYFNYYQDKDKNEYFIGLIEWFDENGKLIEQYKPG